MELRVVPAAEAQQQQDSIRSMSLMPIMMFVTLWSGMCRCTVWQVGLARSLSASLMQVMMFVGRKPTAWLAYLRSEQRRAKVSLYSLTACLLALALSAMIVESVPFSAGLA
mmetsp:Transcript_85747/g.246137  ORF Transcript_85747/g.246137 Transcript_85747/m.246137 type:complete len:111 (-) Transcript_85747:36-368(-)